jgi:pilus assembly protein Flp/PilA
MNKMTRFLKAQGGATLIEYGLIAALVGIACVIAVGALGDSLGESFRGVSSAISSAPGTGGPTPAP